MPSTLSDLRSRYHADTRAAIAWRAEHLPANHPLVLRDRRDGGELHHRELDRAARLGVA